VLATASAPAPVRAAVLAPSLDGRAQQRRDTLLRLQGKFGQKLFLQLAKSYTKSFCRWHPQVRIGEAGELVQDQSIQRMVRLPKSVAADAVRKVR
jgi:hypothetical protein